jgi:tripartite-type tricarboxylate transporter receptor subunit TctC
MNRLKVLLFAALGACSLQATAQSYPTKPVQVILAFTPGSAVDIVGRIVTAKVSEMWGQPIVNDNRSGAGGSIGSAVVARAAPDGYTLLVTSNAHTVNPAIIANLPYETLKDFTDIVPMAEQPNVMVVGGDAPYKTLRDLVAAAKAKPDAINIGHAGIGSGTHLSTLKFIAAANVKVVQVPFKGTPEVITAILGHNVDGYWAPISAVLSNVKSGKLRPLAVTTAKRNATLPDVPTIAEAGANLGLARFDIDTWFGIFAPANLPAETTARLNKAFVDALASADLRARLANLYAEPMPMAPERFAAFVKGELAKYQPLVKASGARVE